MTVSEKNRALIMLESASMIVYRTCKLAKLLILQNVKGLPTFSLDQSKAWNQLSRNSKVLRAPYRSLTKITEERTTNKSQVMFISQENR